MYSMQDIPAPLTTTYTASVEATPHIAPPAQEETRPSTTSSSTARNTYENDTFVNALRRKATSISYTLTSDDAIQPLMRYINSTGHWVRSRQIVYIFFLRMHYHIQDICFSMTKPPHTHTVITPHPIISKGTVLAGREPL
jgi:hypothetical protein